MSDCPHEILLSAHLDGELDESRRRELELHLPQCSSCARELRELQQMRELIVAAAPKPPGITSEMLARIHASVDAQAERSLLRFAEALSGVAAAVLLSALVFSLFHHIGPGASPLLRREFVFRAIAGLVLGVMFVLRGFGVCVYTHTLYDIHYYLTA